MHGRLKRPQITFWVEPDMLRRRGGVAIFARLDLGRWQVEYHHPVGRTELEFLFSTDRLLNDWILECTARLRRRVLDAAFPSWR